MDRIICRDLDNNKWETDSDKLIFRPSIYGVLIKDNKVLLSKQWDGYDLPGGGIKISETIEQALKREFFEEAGLKIEPIKPIHCQTSFFKPTRSKNRSKEYWHSILIYFLVKKIGGQLSKDYFDGEEQDYADLPEWVKIKKIDQIKFYNSIDSVKIIKKAADSI